VLENTRKTRAETEQDFRGVEVLVEICATACQFKDRLETNEIVETVLDIATDIELIKMKKLKRQDLPSCEIRAREVAEKPGKDLINFYKKVDALIWKAIDNKVIELWEAKYILLRETIELLQNYGFWEIAYSGEYEEA